MNYILIGVVDLEDPSKNLRLMPDYKPLKTTITNDFKS